MLPSLRAHRHIVAMKRKKKRNETTKIWPKSSLSITMSGHSTHVATVIQRGERIRQKFGQKLIFEWIRPQNKINCMHWIRYDRKRMQTIVEKICVGRIKEPNVDRTVLSEAQLENVNGIINKFRFDRLLSPRISVWRVEPSKPSHDRIYVCAKCDIGHMCLSIFGHLDHHQSNLRAKRFKLLFAVPRHESATRKLNCRCILVIKHASMQNGFPFSSVIFRVSIAHSI